MFLIELDLTVWLDKNMMKIRLWPTRFFYQQRLFFSTKPHCCLNFSWIELQMLLRNSLVHITIIVLRHILYLVYLCSCLGLGLFMWYLLDLFFFIFSLIFIVIHHIIPFKRMHLFFVHFLEYYLWMITSMKKANNFQIVKVQNHRIV